MNKTVFLFLFYLIFVVSNASVEDSLVQILESRKLSSAEQIGIYEEICKTVYGDLTKRAYYAKQGLHIAEKTEDKLKASFFSSAVAGAYDALSQYDSSLYYFEKSYEWGVSANDLRRQVTALTNIANSYNRQSKYTIALEYYMKVLDMNEKAINSRFHYKYLLGNIAEIHLELKNFDRAFYYIEQAMAVEPEIEDEGENMQPYYVLGCIYKEKGDYKRALDYQFKSAEISKKINYKTYESYSMQSIAQTYMAMEDYENALKYGQECLRIAEELGDPKQCARGWRVLSDIYYIKEAYKECEEAAFKALALDSISLDTGPALAFNIGMANMQLGNKEKAETYLRKYNRLSDKYIDKNYREIMIDMEVKYETEKKEIRIAGLVREKKLYIWLIIAVMGVFLLGLTLVLNRHRLNSQKNKIAEQQIKQLQQEKQLIASQALLEGEAAERSRLSRDLHDGLGGMLSVVRLNLEKLGNYSFHNTAEMNDLTKALNMLDDSINELRRVAHHMMPESLMRYGLKVSLEDFCNAIPGTHFYYLGGEQRFDNRLEVLIYRCAYELINNAVKHAKATNIRVQLMIDECIISLTVNDDGIGFDPETVVYGAGLENIRNRVSSYNGKINIHTSPGKGTEVSIEIESVK